nr:DNA mismatch repair protein MutS [Pyrinomonadaceae bacterium]
MTNLTPMLRQYQELKQQYPGTILFFRLGDFYELFFEDAVTGARELQITLTARHKESGAPVPMCGVPHHSGAGYIARLIRKGYRVAICEQTEDASKTKKLLRREVVRVITPGTAVDPQLLDAGESVYLAAVCVGTDRAGASFLDLSTGEFRTTAARGEEAWESIQAEIESYAPREILFPASLSELVRDAFESHTREHAALPLSGDSQSAPIARISPAHTPAFTAPTLTPVDDWMWDEEMCAKLLCEQFGVRSLEAYGLSEQIEAVRAAGVCLRYARETQRAAAAHVTDVIYTETQDHLVLDPVTVRNLELVESQSGADRSHTLLGVLDATVTGMGARLLRAWLLHPTLRRGEAEARLAAVEEFHSSQMKRDKLRSCLRHVADLERLTGRLNMNTATPRDLLALRRSLEQTPAIKQSLSDATSSLLQILSENLDTLEDVCQLIARGISDDPPMNLADGGAIRDGFSTELDDLRSISRDAKSFIARIETKERARSGIASLRIKFNNVSGYFIEVSRASVSRVPADYERRQTLVNAERYTTPELKDYEHRVLGAEERLIELEKNFFSEIRTEIAAQTKRLQATARSLASIDCLTALAETAVRRRYTRPVLHDGDEVEIKAGRHPVIEATGGRSFIPNDLYMNNSTDRLLVITGPNMGGKSTVMRQTALI